MYMYNEGNSIYDIWYRDAFGANCICKSHCSVILVIRISMRMIDGERDDCYYVGARQGTLARVLYSLYWHELTETEAPSQCSNDHSLKQICFRSFDVRSS